MNVGETRAVVPVPPRPQLRRLLVLGGAGWESRFVITALEEDGWDVDARLHVAPGVTVTQGNSARPETARHSAVIALDETAADYAASILEYVRRGGGLVLGPGAGASASFSGIRAGIPAASAEQPAMTDEGISRATLPLRALSLTRPDAVILDGRGAGVAVVARRHELGRVVQSGFTDTWRWRMAGDSNSVAGHRRFWTSLVSSAAYAPTVVPPPRQQRVALSDPAPFASLVHALGVPVKPPASASAQRISNLSTLLFALALLALLAEWASRRLRGAA